MDEVAPRFDGGPYYDAAVPVLDPEQVQSACQVFASVSCAKRQQCTPGMFDAEYPDVATCEARDAVACTLRLDAPGTSLTPAGLAACARNLARATCANAYDVRPASCKLQPGAIPDGYVCRYNEQCKSTLCVLSAGGCGLCQARIPLGQPCKRSGQCEQGSTCVSDVSYDICVAFAVAFAAENGPCDGNTPCRFPQICRAGTCSAADPPGTPCNPATITCAYWDNVQCLGSPRTCTASPIAALGEVCGADSPTLAVCAAGQACTGSPSKCARRPGDGEACGKNVDCLSPDDCINGTCQRSDGSSCF
jgi:hypothetical protein